MRGKLVVLKVKEENQGKIKKRHTVFTIKTNFSKVRAIYELEALRHDIKDRQTVQDDTFWDEWDGLCIAEHVRAHTVCTTTHYSTYYIVKKARQQKHMETTHTLPCRSNEPPPFPQRTHTCTLHLAGKSV